VAREKMMKGDSDQAIEYIRISGAEDKKSNKAKIEAQKLLSVHFCTANTKRHTLAPKSIECNNRAACKSSPVSKILTNVNNIE
jgi:hypothetical protein